MMCVCSDNTIICTARHHSCMYAVRPGSIQRETATVRNSLCSGAVLWPQRRVSLFNYLGSRFKGQFIYRLYQIQLSLRLGPNGVTFDVLQVPESSHCGNRLYCTLEEFAKYVNHIAAEFAVCMCVLCGWVSEWVSECVCVGGWVCVCVWVGGWVSGCGWVDEWVCVCVVWVGVCVWVCVCVCLEHLRLLGYVCSNNLQLLLVHLSQ